MREISIHRVTQARTSAEIAWENVRDYTHFLHLHRKHFASFLVLFDDKKRQHLYYEMRLLHPLPFTRRYLAVRLLDHARRILHQVYQQAGGNERVYLRCRVVDRDGTVEIHNQFSFQTRSPIAWFPSLFAWLVNRRADRMWREDRSLMTERFRLGTADEPQCAPVTETLMEVLTERIRKEEAAGPGRPTHFRFSAS